MSLLRQGRITKYLILLLAGCLLYWNYLWLGCGKVGREEEVQQQREQRQWEQRELQKQRRAEELHWQEEEVECMETNLCGEEHYDAAGCPVVPLVFSGMTGQLGNVMSTYANMIAIQWRLGFKYFLPRYMNHHTNQDLTKPYLQSIFRNVTFPTAGWDLTDGLARDAGPDQALIFSNSRTAGQEIGCGKLFTRLPHLQPTLGEQMTCAARENCTNSCLGCIGRCLCDNLWVTVATGANYLDLQLAAELLPTIIQRHLQFQPAVLAGAAAVIASVAATVGPGALFVGVHVRRTDFHQFSKFWLSELLNETFYQTAMDHYRARHARPQFLVVSDDMAWCRAMLTGPDIHHVGSTVVEHEMVGPSPPRDLAVMALSNATINDYGTYGMWGSILSGGEVVTSKLTFRDNRWAAEFFGWTMV